MRPRGRPPPAGRRLRQQPPRRHHAQEGRPPHPRRRRRLPGRDRPTQLRGLALRLADSLGQMESVLVFPKGRRHKVPP